VPAHPGREVLVVVCGEPGDVRLVQEAGVAAGHRRGPGGQGACRRRWPAGDEFLPVPGGGRHEGRGQLVQAPELGETLAWVAPPGRGALDESGDGPVPAAFDRCHVRCLRRSHPGELRVPGGVRQVLVGEGEDDVALLIQVPVLHDDEDLQRIGAADEPVHRAWRELDRGARRQAYPQRAVGGEELRRAVPAQREVQLGAGQMQVRCAAALAVGCQGGVDADLG
jgi:hypothetical protein